MKKKYHQIALKQNKPQEMISNEIIPVRQLFDSLVTITPKWAIHLDEDVEDKDYEESL